MPANDRAGVKVDGGRGDGIGAGIDGFVEVRERTIGVGGVEPGGEGVDEEATGGRVAGGGGPHLPVGLGVRVAGVERDAEELGDGRVPGGLHVEDARRHDVELEEAVRVDVVQEPVRGPPLVGEQRVSARRVDGEVLPLPDVVGRRAGEVLRVGGGADDAGDLRHGLDADDAFDGEVGLVDELAGEIVCEDQAC